MNVISINTLCGLHNMLYDKKNLEININNILRDKSLDINNLFWAQILSDNSIHKTVEKYVEISTLVSELSVQEKYVVSAPDMFINKVFEARNNIVTPEISDETLFSYIETLNIFCMLYNKLLPTNFTFSIDQGFHRSSSSSKEMLEHCLLECSNPYLKFIVETVLPILLDYNPNIIWMKGIPNIGSFAIAKLAKQKIPNLHICITDHSTEYYSLNKIKENLLTNLYFFECFDSVILNSNTEETKEKMMNALKNKETLCNVPNIIFKDDDGSINTTKIDITYPKYDFNTTNIPTANYVNLRLFPRNHCYWNQCVFCGINNKYMNNLKSWDLNDALNQMDFLAKNHIKYFWSIDEAIPPSILYQLAKEINHHNWNFLWHTRSRLDIEWLNEDIVKELSVSGLTQIRMGFETASIRILKLMNKHERCEEIINNIEPILELFFKYHIRVHFPAIIGFPTETLYEREQTINYLINLNNKYPLFSYNINILELDISSTLYKNWDKYNITKISLPCSRNCFMGNIVSWYEPITHSPALRLEKSRTNAMLSQYTWYPKNALTEPHIFYRLYESGRYMLYEETLKDTTKIELTHNEIVIKPYPDLVSWRTELGTYITYNPRNHQYYECSESVYNLFNDEGVIIDDERYFSLINNLILKKFIYICEGR